MKVTEFFIDRPKFTNVLLGFMILLGVLTLKSLPRQNMPDVDFDVLTIRTNYPGASPEDVEVKVTDPIEDALESVDGLDRVESFSIENMSYIVVKIDPDLDFNEKEDIKRDVRKAVDRVTDFPQEVEARPFVDEKKSTSSPIIEIAVSGEGIDEWTMRKVAKDLEDDLRGIEGVGEVDKIGYRKKEMQVLADIEKMDEHYVAFGDLLQAIELRNVKLSGGTIESSVNEKKVVTFAEFEEPIDVGDCIVRSNFSGKQLKVSDVALLKDDFEQRRIWTRVNGVDAINVRVKRKPKSDVIRLSRELNVVIDYYQETFSKQGIQVKVLIDYTHYTKNLLDIVINSATLGLILVLLSLFFFLNFQTALWVAIGLPTAILGAFFIFPYFDMTVNQIVLIAMIIVLGMLVDDAIVVAENINRYQQEGLSFREAAILGTQEVFKPICVTILTTISCFAPMYFMTGILGKFVFTIPTVIISMLLLSLFESVTILPCHLAHSKASRIRPVGFWMTKLRNFYGRFLRRLLHHRGLFIVIAISMLIGSVFFSVATNRFVLFPTNDANVFYIVIETKVGDSMEQTLEKIKQIEDRVSEISPEILNNFKVELGHHRTEEAINTPAEHEEWALFTVFLKPASERDVRSEVVIEELRKDFKNLTGFNLLQVRKLQGGPPVGAPITITLVSDDFEGCEVYEKKIWDDLSNLDGVYALETTNRIGKDEVRLHLNYSLMAQVGLTARDVADTMRMAYDGVVATSMRRDGEEIDFRLRLRDDQRGKEDWLKQLLLRNADGKLISLEDVASFSYGQSKESINHYSGRKSITITGKVDTEKVTSTFVNKMIRDSYEKKIKATSGLKMIFGGEEEETKESMQNFKVAFLCGLIGIYFILLLLLNSYIQPFLIMATIPFGIIGVLIAFYLHGLPMSFLGLIGTLGMIGVVVNDSLVMVTYLNKLKEKYGRVDEDMVIEGAKMRFRQVFLTTITTVLGLLPTVYGIGGYEPFLVPVVLAMSWGLAFSTVITLGLVPVLYSFQK